MSDADRKSLRDLARALALPSVQPNVVGEVLDSIRPFLTSESYGYLLKQLKELVG